MNVAAGTHDTLGVQVVGMEAETNDSVFVTREASRKLQVPLQP